MIEPRLLEELAEVLDAVGVLDQLDDVGAMDGGHIHRTWSVHAGGQRLVCQALNGQVFTDFAACEENLRRIDDYVRSVGEAAVRVPTLRRTANGRVQVRSTAGSTWRVSDYAVGTVSRAVARSVDEAKQAAFAYGSYARMLQGVPGPPLRHTIAGFHDLPARARLFEASVAQDRIGRVMGAASLVDTARAMQVEALEHVAEIRALPRINVHNDAKVSNVRFDERTGAARYIVDLDTTMPGSVLFDIGELLRTASTDAAEDEPDPATIRVHTDRIEAVVHGFVAGAGELIDSATRRALPLAGPLMALENATRFLTDHLDGDVYFAIDKPGHNLVRAAAQLRVAQLLTDAADVVAVAALA